MSKNTGWTAEDERAVLDSIGHWVDKDVRPVAREFDTARPARAR